MKTLSEITAAAALLLLLTGLAGLAGAQRWRQEGGADRFPQPGNWLWTTTRRAQQGRQRPAATTPAPSSPSPQQLVDSRGHPVNCTCPSTEEHNPVCGTNGATYNNPGKLRCAQRCGYEVELAFYGNCDPLLG